MSGEVWTVTGPEQIELEEVRAVRIGLVGGRVDVIGRDEPGARVEVHAVRGRPLEIGLVDGELRIGYATTLTGWEKMLERFRGVTTSDAAEVHVAVRHDVPVRLGTVSADGLLAGTTADASVSTVSGSLVTDSTSGRLTAKTVSGDLVLRAHDGGLHANGVSGTVTASGAFDQLGVTTVSGAVVVDAARAVSVAAQTVSGDVTVRVPAGLGLEVTGRSVSGRVVVDEAESGASGPGGGSFARVVGDGACHVRVTTVSGDVTVLRAVTEDRS